MNKEKYEGMDKAALENELKRLEALLDEVIEEREMIFSTTGIHRSVQYYVMKYETEIGELKESIASIKGILESQE